MGGFFLHGAILTYCNERYPNLFKPSTGGAKKRNFQDFGIGSFSPWIHAAVKAGYGNWQEIKLMPVHELFEILEYLSVEIELQNDN